MAQVPTYGGPQVRSSPLQTPMQSTPDVSSGLQVAARALNQIGDVAEQYAVREAETQANSVDSKVTADWLNWDSENRSKYQGQNVDEYAIKAREWWDKVPDTYGKDLTPLAKRRLGEVIPRKQNQALGAVLGYVGTEKDRFADQSAEAAAQTSIEFGIDTGNVDSARQEVRTITAQQGARKGWTTEQVQAEQQRRLGTLHLAYITRLSQSDPEAASSYFEKNKTEIPATAQVKVEQVLTGERDNQFALKFAAENATLPLDEQLAKAAGIADPTRREKAIQNIKVNQGLVKAAQQAREAQASDQAWQYVGQGRKVPEAVLGVMNGRERVQLQDYLRQRAEHMATQGSKPVKTDPTELARIYDLQRDDPEAFKTLRMEALAFKLAGSDLEQVARLQRDMRDPGKEKDAVSVSMQIGAYTRGMNPNDRASFESAAQDDIIRFQEENKRPPTSKERQQMFDALKLEGMTHDGWLWDTRKKTFQMTPEERDKAVYPKQPTQAAGDKFVKGKVYRDGNGNMATYLGGGKWGPAQ